MGVVADLKRLSAAEELFTYLDVPYEAEVLNVSRLHILRKMGNLLRAAPSADGADAADEEAVRATFKAHLEQAYAELCEKGPLEQRLFKVHQDAVRPKTPKPAPFVSLASLVATVPTKS
jgi:nitrogenase-stabilizing/protective protein